MNGHWTLDELTLRLYGIHQAGGEEHLASCPECAERLEVLNRRRAAMAADQEIGPELSPARWAAQRNAVLQRIASPSRRVPRWVPALTAAACLLAVAVFVHRPASIAPRQVETGTATVGITGDAQLFADIYTVEEAAEPRAAAPMHALFQEGQQ